MTESNVHPRPPFDWPALVAWLLLSTAVAAITLWMAFIKPAPAAPAIETSTVIVPKQDWLAYHFIQSADLTITALPTADVPTATITSTATLSGFISLAPLAANQPITTDRVIPVTDATLIANKIVIAIEGGPALVFDGQLRPGTVVSAWVGKRQITNRLLVLDVRQLESGERSEALPRYIVILAVSPNLRNEVVAAAAEGALSFSGDL